MFKFALGSHLTHSLLNDDEKLHNVHGIDRYHAQDDAVKRQSLAS